MSAVPFEALQRRLFASAQHVEVAVTELHDAMLAMQQAFPTEQHDEVSRHIVALAEQIGQYLLTAAVSPPVPIGAESLHVGQYL